jgi:isopenicillin N synthase-like dioxygenase
MTGAFRTVPSVDIAALGGADPAARAVVGAALGAAAREAGFLYVTGHGLDPGLVERLHGAAAAYFARPLDEKLRRYIGGSTSHSGYVPEGEEVFAGGGVDRKEAYDIALDLPQADDRTPMSGPTLWPDDPALRAAASGYYAAISAVAGRLFGGFALALGLPQDHFAPHLTQPPSQLRLVHYPPGAAEDAARQGIGAHTDYEFFTLLHATAPGLEALNGAGEWVDIPPRPGALIVNIGDMLEAWTNGEFRATTHRVRAVSEERFSFPFFATCDYWTVVAPHPNFVGPERPARYPAIVSGEHLFAQTVKTFAYLKARRSETAATVAFGRAAHAAAPGFRP